MAPSNEKKCTICGKPFPDEFLISGYGIRKELEAVIHLEAPEWNDDCLICETDFNRIRRSYIQNLVTEARGRTERLEQEVIRSIHESELLSINSDLAFNEKISPADRISDTVARFGGSWNFILSFFAILVGWIVLNGFLLASRPFDPYPFILLNLILSCIAAIQAPIIMMSQNRQEAKDRLRSENDYKINLKAEIEVRTLHEKMDHLLLDQWARLMQIQEIQLDMLAELGKEKKR